MSYSDEATNEPAAWWEAKIVAKVHELRRELLSETDGSSSAVKKRRKV